MDAEKIILRNIIDANCYITQRTFGYDIDEYREINRGKFDKLLKNKTLAQKIGMCKRLFETANQVSPIVMREALWGQELEERWRKIEEREEY